MHAGERAKGDNTLALSDERSWNKRKARPFRHQGLEQALSDALGTAPVDLVMPHGDPLDVWRHEAKSAWSVSNLQLVIEATHDVGCATSHIRFPVGGTRDFSVQGRCCRVWASGPRLVSRYVCRETPA